MIYKIISKTYITLPRKTKADKKIYLNLNTYRNLHHIINSQAKKQYLSDVREQLDGLVIQCPIEISYRVYKPTKRIMDKMNCISIVSKFLLDALVELGCIPDDNDDIVKTEVLLPTIYDKGNGRVEVIITEL